jgi:hydrogenase maturation protease
MIRAYHARRIFLNLLSIGIKVSPALDNTSSQIVVIGVGNTFRCDDAVGIFVAEKLRNMKLPNIVVAEEARDGLRMMGHWNRGDQVILIDAVSSNAEEGTIHRIDLLSPGYSLPPAHTSTHSMGIVEAISLSRIVKTLPARVILYGIDGKNFGMGTALSPKVLDSANRVIEMILDEVRCAPAYPHENPLEIAC